MTNSRRKTLSAIIALVSAFALMAGAAGCQSASPAPQQSAAAQQSASTATVTASATAQATATPAAATATPQALAPEAGAKLKVWETEDDGSGKWIQELGKEFEQKYGVPVTYEPVSHTDAAKKLATDGPAKKGADVFCSVNDNLGALVSAGLVYPNDLTDPSVYMDAATKACTYNGVLYGYPTSIETYALVYNKDLVTTAPKTWDDVIAFSKQFTDVKNQKYGFLVEPGNFYFLYGFMKGNGGYVFGKDGTDPTDIGLNNDGAVAGANLIRQFADIAAVKSGDITYDIKEGLFKEKKLAMHIMGPWALKSYKDAGVNYAVEPLPLLAGGKHPISFSGVRALYVNSYTEYPNAAKLFAQFCTTKEALLKRYTEIGQIPPRLDLLDDPAIVQNADMHAFLEQAQYSEPMPSIPQMSAVWDQMKAAICALWDDKNADTKATLDNAVQKIKDANAVAAGN